MFKDPKRAARRIGEPQHSPSGIQSRPPRSREIRFKATRSFSAVRSAVRSPPQLQVAYAIDRQCFGLLNYSIGACSAGLWICERGSHVVFTAVP